MREPVDGFCIFLTIVDDYARVTWVYMLKQKSDVHTIFPDFFLSYKLSFPKPSNRFDPTMLMSLLLQSF